MGRVFIELRGVGAGQAHHMPGELDRRALHAQADAEKRNAPLADIADGFDFAFDSALAKAARDEYAIISGQERGSPFALDILALNAADADLALVMNPGMVERFVDRLVSVLVLGIFSDDGDADLVLGISQYVQDVPPMIEIEQAGP